MKRLVVPSALVLLAGCGTDATPGYFQSLTEIVVTDGDETPDTETPPAPGVRICESACAPRVVKVAKQKRGKLICVCTKE